MTTVIFGQHASLTNFNETNRSSVVVKNNVPRSYPHFVLVRAACRWLQRTTIMHDMLLAVTFGSMSTPAPTKLCKRLSVYYLRMLIAYLHEYVHL